MHLPPSSPSHINHHQCADSHHGHQQRHQSPRPPSVTTATMATINDTDDHHQRNNTDDHNHLHCQRCRPLARRQQQQRTTSATTLTTTSTSSGRNAHGRCDGDTKTTRRKWPMPGEDDGDDGATSACSTSRRYGSNGDDCARLLAAHRGRMATIAMTTPPACSSDDNDAHLQHTEAQQQRQR